MDEDFIEESSRNYEENCYYNHSFGNGPSYHYKNGWEDCLHYLRKTGVIPKE